MLTTDTVWRNFDGWCCARGVDPRVLTIERSGHLGYHYLTRNLDAEKRTSFDGELRDLGTALAPEQARTWQDDGAPSWWVDEEEAARSTLSATGMHPPRSGGEQ